MSIEQEWRPLAYLPGYEINRKGTVRNATNKCVQLTRRVHGQLGVMKQGRWGSIAALLEETFGTGAAEAVGFQQPNLRRVLASRKDNRRKTKMSAKRHCTSCGKPTNNYRCDACWSKRNGCIPHMSEGEVV